MEEFYTGIRIANLTLACCGFWIVWYKGIRVYMDQRQHYNWGVFFLGCWFFLTAYGTGEQLYLETKPGPRTFLTLALLTSCCIYVARLKAPYVRK